MYNNDLADDRHNNIIMYAHYRIPDARLYNML